MKKISLLALVFMLMALLIPTRYFIFIDQNFGRAYYQYVPSILLDWRVHVLNDYEVFGSYDILSYYVYKINDISPSEPDRNFYVSQLMNLLQQLELENYYKPVVYKLMIESVHEKQMETFSLLYCSFEGISFEDIKFNY
jgi:hypothetical protein